MSEMLNVLIWWLGAARLGLSEDIVCCECGEDTAKSVVRVRSIEGPHLRLHSIWRISHEEEKSPSLIKVEQLVTREWVLRIIVKTLITVGGLRERWQSPRSPYPEALMFSLPESVTKSHPISKYVLYISTGMRHWDSDPVLDEEAAF